MSFIKSIIIIYIFNILFIHSYFTSTLVDRPRLREKCLLIPFIPYNATKNEIEINEQKHNAWTKKKKTICVFFDFLQQVLVLEMHIHILYDDDDRRGRRNIKKIYIIISHC